MRGLVRGVCCLAAVALACAATAATAFAGGSGAQTFTQHDKHITQVMPPGTGNGNPCSGVDGTLTQTFNDVFHGTINKTGSWFTGTITGTLTFVPVDPSQPTYQGHFTAWFGDENNLRNDVEHSTLNVNAWGSDGSHLVFHENVQAAMNANGVVTVSFDHAFCG